jgi:hypothetical protein
MTSPSEDDAMTPTRETPQKPRRYTLRKAGVLGGVVFAALLVLAAGSYTSPRTANDASEAVHSSDCLVATVGGERVTLEDAEALETIIHPPPPRDVASRLAVDTAVAHLLEHGFLSPATAKERLLAYRRLVRDVRAMGGSLTQFSERLSSEVARGWDEAPVMVGDCYSFVDGRTEAARDGSSPPAQ